MKTNYFMTNQAVWTFRKFFLLQFNTKFLSKQQRLAKIGTILWLLLSTQISQVWHTTRGKEKGMWHARPRATAEDISHKVGLFKPFVMDNKAYTFSHLPDSNNRGCQSFFKLNNSIYKKKKNLQLAVKFFCKCYCWVWTMVDSLYHSSRKIPERCENSFVDYKINYQKLCYLRGRAVYAYVF